MLAYVCLILAASSMVVFAQMSEECKAMPRPKVKGMDCCPIDNLMDNDAWQKCKNDGAACIGDCVFKSNNLIKDNALDIDAIKAFAKKQLPGTEWATTIDTAINLCSTSVADFPLEHSCETRSEPLMMCMHHSLVRSCPDSVWKKDDDCAELKTFMQKCPRPFRRPTQRPN